VTPRRPVKLYYSSSSSRSTAVKKPSDKPTKTATPSSSIGTVIPASSSPRRQKSGKEGSTPGSWKEIPSPLTNGAGQELDNCDALLAELGLSPMPKGLFPSKQDIQAAVAKKQMDRKSYEDSKKKSAKVSPKKRTPSKSPKKQAKSRLGISAQPSPLRQLIDPSASNDMGANMEPSISVKPVTRRNSLYKRLFEMKPKKHEPLQPVQIAPKSSTCRVSAKLKVGPDMHPTRSVKPLTVPREFSFSTDQRLKRSHAPVLVQKGSVRSILTSIRSAAVNRIVKAPTKPMSPKLTKRTITMVSLELQPEVILPAKPVISQVKLRPVVSRPPPRVTVPRSPNFTCIRPRKTTPSSQAASNSFLATPFKARPAPKFGKPFEPVLPHHHTLAKNITLPGDRLNLAKKHRMESAAPTLSATP